MRFASGDEQFHLLMESVTDDAILFTDRERRIVTWNTGFTTEPLAQIRFNSSLVLLEVMTTEGVNASLKNGFNSSLVLLEGVIGPVRAI